MPGGQLITPFTYVQADANWIDADDPTAGIGSDEANGRVMPAVGVEYEWPFLATLGSTVHTFGPKAQLIARPNEWHPGALPNEDSQSLVFDDTSLFEWDKFSGYDRQEGGTRANLGFALSGALPERRDDRCARRALVPARRRELLRASGSRADRHWLGPGIRTTPTM